MHLSRIARAAAVAAMAATLVAGPAAAGGPRVETGFYNGQVVEFLQPAVFSAKPNGGTFACFGLGPDLVGHVTRRRRRRPCTSSSTTSRRRITATATPRALRHDHVLSTVPGAPATRARGS